jgi:hypothetical protein
MLPIILTLLRKHFAVILRSITVLFDHGFPQKLSLGVPKGCRNMQQWVELKSWDFFEANTVQVGIKLSL